MYSSRLETSVRIQLFKRLPSRIAGLFVILAAGVLATYSQGDFSSGSTGADGAFSPVANQTVQIPESGVFNYTTINIPSGVTITFLPNSRNTPVTMLATGSITIAGTISVNGSVALSNGIGGKGGPGGFKGGNRGQLIDSMDGTRGDGPGGGAGALYNSSSYPNAGGGGGFGAVGSDGGGASTPNGIGGPVYGSVSLLPLIGGSGGGGGGNGMSGYQGTAAGGGGGAILLASSGTLTVTGSITAVGGNGGNNYYSGTGGGGSGGAIRLIANTLVGNGNLDVRGGAGGNIVWSCPCGGAGGRGFVRAEAYDYTGFSPATNSVPIIITFPNPVTVPNAAQLQITTIAGVTVPAQPKGSLYQSPDITLPGSLANPVTVQIQAANVPLASIVQVTVTPPNGARTTFQSTGLAGTVNASTATASINLPNGMCVITVSLTVDLQVAQYRPMFFNGEKITHMVVASTLGGKSETTYITKTGKKVSLSELVQ